MKERSAKISFPAEFTISMSSDEAVTRMLAGKMIKGVTFEVRDPHDPGFFTYAAGQGAEGKVIATTIADNDEALNEYAQLVSNLLEPAPSTEKRS